MSLLLGDVYDCFKDDGVAWHEFTYELVANIIGYVLIDTGGVIWVSVAVFFIGGTVNTIINSFARTGIGLLYYISWIFEFLLARKVAAAYAFGGCNWYIYMSIAAIDKCLAISGTKWRVRASTLSIIRSGMKIIIKLHPSSSCDQKQTVGIVP